MKIGQLELSISTFVYGAILLALLVVVPLVGLSKWSAMRESWYRTTILTAITDGGDQIEYGVKACQALIAADPTKPAPRMYLGCLYCLTKNYKDAQEAFDKVQDAAKATAEDKSLALAAEGCAACLAGEKDGKPGNLELAERLFQRALDYKRTPDALGAMALLKSWKSDKEAEPFVKEAFATEPAPGLAMLEQLYRLQGAIYSRNLKPGEAGNAYSSVKALNPGNNQMDDAARYAMLSSLNQPGMEPAARKAAIEKMMTESNKFGKSENDALLAIGLGWHSLKTEKDYYALNGPFDKARMVFRQMIDRDPKDMRAYKSLAALLDERFDSLASELTVNISGVKGESPKVSSWDLTGGPADKTPASEKYSPEDKERLFKILALVRDQEALWKRLVDQGDPSPEDKIDAKIRMLACVRRQFWLAGEFDLNQRESLLRRAQEIATDAAKLDTTGRAHSLLALVLIDKNDLAGARAAFLESSKRGYTSPESTKLLAALEVKPRLADAGPMPALEREFGALQLIRATLESPLGLSALKNLKVFLNGTDIPVTIFGSQILYTPSNINSSGGKKTVHIVAGEASGAPIIFPDFSFLIDTEGPVCETIPAPGVIKGDAVITITLKDDSGIDWGTLACGMRSNKSLTAAPFDVVFIRDGHYTRTLAGAAKTGEFVLRSPFKIAAPTDAFQPGEYKLWIEVKDVLGNKTKDEKAFTVK